MDTALVDAFSPSVLIVFSAWAARAPSVSADVSAMARFIMILRGIMIFPPYDGGDGASARGASVGAARLHALKTREAEVGSDFKLDASRGLRGRQAVTSCSASS
jgi:hypothetical protein